ncbi:MAG TPA: MdtA/MuxA family multidrug efflux RND transporter periplasmic adaptor subunit [Terriglobia bacterium]|nr:MdtA/MuxA family multidrug efflux RND transporter periplasmic adaptor subunit [Terriglobia bacterium]
MSEQQFPPLLEDDHSPLRDPQGEHSPPARGSWLWLFILVVLLAAAAVYFLRPANNGGKTASTTSKAAGSSPRGAAAGPIPVVATRARKGEIGVYLTGLGAVTPIYTVTLKSRVDGQLMQVHYKEGDLVHQGDLLVEIDPRPYQAQLTQFEGLLTRDRALLDNARIDLARYTTLLAQNAVPEQQVATQKALVNQYEGTVKNDQGQIDAAKLNIEYCNITAPITGRVGLRLVDPGNIVHASDASGLLVITQVQPISVIFTIAEDFLPDVLKKVRAGQHLTVDAFDRSGWTQKLASGRLMTIDNEIDQTTGTLRFRANFDNRDNALFPNQFVNTRLLVEQKQGVTLVSNAAIERNSQATYVYAVKPDSTVTVRKVSVGTTEGDDTEVTSGLSPGDAVVTSGVDKLQEGSKVKAEFQEDPNSKGN